jgi:hypothetical protein
MKKRNKKKGEKNIQNDIQISNKMLYLSLKEEIENLKEDGIYISNLVIAFDIQIENR